MDQVLTDANLVNYVFWCIDDQSLRVVRRALLNWCMVNHTFCGACKADLPKAVDALLQRVFEKEFKRYGADLALLFASANVSLDDRVWALNMIRRHYRERPVPKPLTARMRFITDVALEYGEEKQRNQERASYSPAPFLTLFAWSKPRWDNLSPFKRAVYDLSFKVDQRAFDRATNAVANAFMAQVAAEVLAQQ
jgi:hypothetical protein